ncbi:hypothetical protein H257_06294 [Aphanomyces astaci]|uniref:PH domain-containing protein n=1 Tax=Aphanomyces astaci TaxID=112090 RepID=W4GPM0_APHAT|nr:hypothetical protein H257_06294 [Aphanomyces astaci]ETV80828.1 hypothetical protein H257_06294 [Aphanomyces astaci]|eukprot:XP_009829775.1 hypothetical protein H257_06294 [Aphanomyces astaci]
MHVNLSKIHQTSCEGYVTKRGHLMKSWKRRYMVLNGDTLLVSYYDSKEIYTSKGHPKGSFVLSECEKQDLSDEGASVKPFGFKFIGHCPGQGYKEYSVYVESQIDQTKWLNVAHNALGKNSSPQKSMSQRIEEITGPLLPCASVQLNCPRRDMIHITTLGHKESAGLMQSLEAQMKNVKKTSQELLQQAINDAKEADRIGDATVNEMVYQEDVLNDAEGTVDTMGRQMDHAEDLGRSLKHPILYKLTHLFTRKKSYKKGGRGSKTRKGGAKASRSSRVSRVKLQPPQQQHAAAQPEDDQLDQLSKILAKLGQTADTISDITARTTEQVDRIDQKVTSVDDRVKKEAKLVQAVLKAEMT